MRIGIHKGTNNDFSRGWIEYCIEKKIPFKIINAYDNDIIEQLKDCTAFMWHFSNYNYRDMIVARHILFTAESMGLKIFPDFKTSWHFDDKVAQKYLLESIGAPLVPSFVFVDKNEAIKFVNSIEFPIVAKLRKGAGSKGVWLIKNKDQALRYINKSFGKGIPQMNFREILLDRVKKFFAGKESFKGVIKGFVRLFIKSEYALMSSKEKGYVYFQEFIPNNNFDIRIIIIGNKAIGLKRYVRRNDFRASGSGLISYDQNEIDKRCIEISFDVTRKTKTQSLAFDFVFDINNEPKIVEISYGFFPQSYDACTGFWDDSLTWHNVAFNMYGWMIENLLSNNE